MWIAGFRSFPYPNPSSFPRQGHVLHPQSKRRRFIWLRSFTKHSRKKSSGLRVEQERIFPLAYRGEYVGAYIADIVVENTIILERGSVKALNEVMEAQLGATSSSPGSR